MERDALLFEAICEGDRERVRQIVQAAVDQGKDYARLLDNTMIPAIRDMGDRFSRGEAFVPEMLVAARAMQGGLDVIQPLLGGAGRKPRARVCIGTVKGDLHDIGKNLVAMMLRSAGFEVKDLGVDCGLDRFEAAVSEGYTVVCLSALVTTTMAYMRQVVEGFAGREDVAVIVGGAPLTQEYAAQIGAHGYGKDANEAIQVVERCLAARS